MFIAAYTIIMIRSGYGNSFCTNYIRLWDTQNRVEQWLQSCQSILVAFRCVTSTLFGRSPAQVNGVQRNSPPHSWCLRARPLSLLSSSVHTQTSHAESHNALSWFKKNLWQVQKVGTIYFSYNKPLCSRLLLI